MHIDSNCIYVNHALTKFYLLHIGMNSILVYMGHEILHQYFPFGVYDEKNTHLTFLFSNLISVCIWLLISYYWFSVQFFVKI